MSVKRIGLLGFGTVGTGVYELVTRNLWEAFEVTVVGVRDANKPRPLHFPRITTNLMEVVESPDVDVVVEVIGGIDPARALIKHALSLGKPVVTANKELVAKHFDELTDFGGELRYEAAVAGGIPVIQVLQTLVKTNRIERVSGVLNGTTNYILSEMELQERTFEQALASAKDLGFAEADPTADVEGFDALYKACILGSIASGMQLDLSQATREGITSVSLDQIRQAKAETARIKLIAEWDMELGLSVKPTRVSMDNPLSQVMGPFNAVQIRGDFVGDLTLVGRGAGGSPTASAIAHDLVQLRSLSLPNQ